MKHRGGYLRAVKLARDMDDAEIMEFHREVSRLARAAYGRSPRWQSNYKTGMMIAAPRIAEANARMEAFAAHRRGISVAEYRRLKDKSASTPTDAFRVGDG